MQQNGCLPHYRVVHHLLSKVMLPSILHERPHHSLLGIGEMGGKGFVGGKRSLQAPNQMLQAMVHPQDRIDEQTRAGNGNQNRRLQLTSQPQYTTGNVLYHVHIKCPQSISPHKSYCTFPQQLFLIELHPERNHTKLHQLWDDILAPT